MKLRIGTVAARPLIIMHFLNEVPLGPSLLRGIALLVLTAGEAPSAQAGSVTLEANVIKAPTEIEDWRPPTP
ncbi:MAG: hypothetical protein ACKV19_28070 [Verrucomicrobiales bacterium]